MERNVYRSPRSLVFTSQTSLSQFLIHPPDCAIDRVTVSDAGLRSWAIQNLGIDVPPQVRWAITDPGGELIASGTHDARSGAPTVSTGLAIQAAAIHRTLLMTVGILGSALAIPDGVEVFVTVTLLHQAVA